MCASHVQFNRKLDGFYGKPDIPTYFSLRAVETKKILQKKSAKQAEVQGYMLIFPLKRMWISTPQ